VSLHYLIDGYNLLYALPEIPPGPWATKREVFLSVLANSNPQGKNRMTVVFDSRDGGGSRTQRGAIEIVYTAGETADDWIIAAVRKTPNPRVTVVVTNDQTIRRLIRGTGAKWLSTQDFLKKSPDRPKETRPEADSTDSEEITEEFKKKWL
jgi:predicted RNA-binding protein with PIN domain